MNRRTMLAALSATTAIAFPAISRAATPVKVEFGISNETGGSFQTFFKSLGDEYTLPTPAKRTSYLDLPATDIVLVMFVTGPHGDKKRAFIVSIPDGAGAKPHIKLVARTDAKGVYIDTADGAGSVSEINVLTYLNS